MPPGLNSLFCGQCGTQIPVDSIFCPMCGSKTALPGAATMPLPPAVEPLPTWEPARPEAPRPPRTLELAPTAVGPALAPTGYGSALPAHQLAPAPELVAPAPPARVAADPRAVVMPAPAPIPITRRPRIMLFGAALVLAALCIALFYLPRHRPLSASAEAALAAGAGQAEVVRQRRARFSEEVYVGGNVGAAALALAGLGFILAGAFHRAEAYVRCRRCLRPVAASRGSFGLHCPLGPHYARVQWIAVALTAFFWAGLLTAGIVLAVWLA